MKIYQVLLLFLLSGCIVDYSDSRLKIINNMEHRISVDSGLDTVPNYPSLNHTQVYVNQEIKANDTASLIQQGSKNGWPFLIRKSKNKRLNLFIYNIDSLNVYSIDTLIRKKIYKRLSFTEQEMIHLKWMVKIEN